MDFEDLDTFNSINFDDISSSSAYTTGNSSPYHFPGQSADKKSRGRPRIRSTEELREAKKARNRRDKARYRQQKNEQAEEIFKLREESFNLSDKLFEAIKFMASCAKGVEILNSESLDNFLEINGLSQFMTNV